MPINIPYSSISRLSLYYRALLSIKGAGVISSQELSELTGCGACQVRKDLAYFGQFGRPGLGYHVEVLRKELRKILGIDRHWNVALIGLGNLGSALLAYKGFKKQGFNIKFVFDNDSKKVGKIKQGVKIQGMEELEQVLKSNHVSIAIVAVPSESAREVIDRLTTSGIKAILNFAPIRVRVRRGVEVLNIDLSMELEKLTYFLQRAH